MSTKIGSIVFSDNTIIILDKCTSIDGFDLSSYDDVFDAISNHIMNSSKKFIALKTQDIHFTINTDNILYIKQSKKG